jgi:hypothetical protein
MSKSTSIVSISRDSGYADRLRVYRVICDDVEIGRIANGKSGDFAIAPGAHRLILRVDWCSSNELAFTVGNDQTARFSCGSNLRGFRLLLALYYIVFARTRYLWLTQGAPAGNLSVRAEVP